MLTTKEVTRTYKVSNVLLYHYGKGGRLKIIQEIRNGHTHNLYDEMEIDKLFLKR